MIFMNFKQFFKKLPMQLIIIKNQGLHFWLEYLKASCRYFSFILTVIVAIITIFKFFNENVHYDRVVILGFSFDFRVIIVSAIVSSLVYAFIKKLPSVKSQTKVGDINVILECCDLLNQEGLKVIHTTDTFDTVRLDKKSLMGQFVDNCTEVGFNLYSAIKQKLNKNSPDFLETDTSLPGETNRYKLGTICPIYIEEMNSVHKIDRFGTYCLVAFTHMAPDTAKLEPSEYRGFFLNMWYNLTKAGIVENDIVNVTVMGNKLIHFSDKYTLRQRIGILLETFFESCHNKICCHTLRICITEKEMSNIDFSEFNTIIKHLSGRSQL